jgi:hypothetical protein
MLGAGRGQLGLGRQRPKLRQPMSCDGSTAILAEEPIGQDSRLVQGEDRWACRLRRSAGSAARDLQSARWSIDAAVVPP